MSLSSKTKRSILFAMTAVAVAYVRHGLTTKWGNWESLWEFTQYWFIHAVGLSVFILVTIPAITHFRKIFVDSSNTEPSTDDQMLCVLLTVLIACFAIFTLAHWIPAGDDFNYE